VWRPRRRPNQQTTLSGPGRWWRARSFGYKDTKTTLIYAHLAPEHLRRGMANTERNAENVSEKNTWRTHASVRDEGPWETAALTP
jgi:hypothetical protein